MRDVKEKVTLWSCFVLSIIFLCILENENRQLRAEKELLEESNGKLEERVKPIVKMYSQPKCECLTK